MPETPSEPDLLLVGQDARPQCLLGAPRRQSMALQRGVGADAVVVAVGADEAAVEAHVAWP